MAQKPDKFPDWATEEEIDEVSGQANFVEPPDFRKESGWTRREIPPRQWFNWLARKTGLWFRWVEDRVEGLQYASDEEALAGEAEDRVIAPARFGDQSLTTNGYQVLPGGMIVQWGSESGSSGSITFPVQFSGPDTFSFNATHEGSENATIFIVGGSKSESGLGWRQRNSGNDPNSNSFRWMAIGY